MNLYSCQNSSQTEYSRDIALLREKDNADLRESLQRVLEVVEDFKDIATTGKEDTSSQVIEEVSVRNL